MKEFVPRAVLLHLLAVLGIVLLPHLQRLFPWEAPFILAVMLWRTLATLRQWRPLNRWARVALTFIAFAAVYAQYGNIAGQTAGTALLAVMACLKLTELNARRDLMVMVLLLYFLLITHFLFSQEIWTAFYLLGCAVLITALLVEANHPDAALPLRVSLRAGGRLVLHALPLMVVLFLLFPRVPGPLWGLPSDAGAAQSGLADDMGPDDISNLIDSDEVAFRVRFFGPAPPPEKMYWRGPVLAQFDGKRWQAGWRPGANVPPPSESRGPQYDYEMVLEPQRRRWLLALDLPDRGGLPADAQLTSDFQLVAHDDVRERRLYRLKSHATYLLQADLPASWRGAFLQLPRGYNPRALALARQWREQGLDDLGVVKAALDLFRGKNFYYTLTPPRLGSDGVDEFLFDTHRGFCEHYSSSFTVLMRAAGIPARVVAGYQGATRNDVGDYYVVQQSDAHAWSEVWLQGQGWVRVDPTAAVAPERVLHGIASALADSGTMPAFMDRQRNFALLAALKVRWDSANELWNRWFLGYGPDLQQQIMGRLGLVDWSDMILALTVAISLVLGLLGLGLARQLLPRREPDAVLQQWRKAGRRLRRAGLEQRLDEGPLDFSGRVVRARPDLAPAMQRICALYLRLRYLDTPEAAQLRELSQAVAALRA